MICPICGLPMIVIASTLDFIIYQCPRCGFIHEQPLVNPNKGRK